MTVPEEGMSRRLSVLCAVIILVGSSAATAQRAPQARPPLFLSEGWKALTTPPDDHGAWPASQAAVASPNLQLTLHGTSAKEIVVVAVRGNADLYPLNLWTGTTTSPSAASLRDRANFVDLTDPLAKIRWTVRTSGFHQVRPIVKLADGTWLVGDRADGSPRDWIVSEFFLADVRWLRLDIAQVVTKGTILDTVDLTKVEEVGFADLMPGSGHGPGGWADVAQVEVYGKPVPRVAAAK
jgi:hypothetical protein